MDDEEKLLDIVVIVWCVIVVVVVVVCLLGNVMVLGMFVFVKYFKIFVFVVIGCLVLVDILCVLLEVFFYVIKWMNNGDIMIIIYCKVIVYFSEVGMFVVVFSVVLLSIVWLLLFIDRG